jgi:hypothetical protein
MNRYSRELANCGSFFFTFKPMSFCGMIYLDYRNKCGQVTDDRATKAEFNHHVDRQFYYRGKPDYDFTFLITIH